jgi:hypothetical protein
MQVHAPTPAPEESQAVELTRVIAEFGRHLAILADQLGASLLEADRECVSVGASFDDLAAAKTAIDGVECPEPARGELQRTARQMGESLQAAVVALQYHDRLAQRLGLIRAGLDRLQTLLHSGPGRSHAEWLVSLDEVERINRAERQRLDHDAGASAAPDSTAHPKADDTVELF